MAQDDLLVDPFDLALLAELQRDAHATNQALGDKLHLSASQISRRIQRLESAGLIQRYAALLDASLLGLGVRAFSYVTLSRHGDEGEAFERAITQVPEVLDCYAVTGESDYVLHIVAPTLAELSDSVLRRVIRIPGVASVRSNIVLRPIKSTTALPLEHLEKPMRRTRRVRLTVRDA